MTSESRVLKAGKPERYQAPGACGKRQGRLTAVLLALLLLGVIKVVPAAEKRLSIPARVSELLRRFPAQSEGEKAALAAEVLKLGEEAIIELCRRLSPPGKADDSLVRYALEAAGSQAMRPGGESGRNLYSRAVIKALKTSADPEVKMFLVGRLQQTGGPESIEPLSRLLSDRALAEPAVRALLAIRAPGTDKALLKALRASGLTNKALLLGALGELRSREAVGRIAPFASDLNGDIREAALSALAKIGDPRTEFLLSRMEIASSPRERAGAALRYLLFAQRLAETGRKEDALRISRSLVEKCTGLEESQVRCAALTHLARVAGREALPDLIQAMDSPDAGFRVHALDLSLEIPGEEATPHWIAKAAEVSSAARAQIIRMLGRRKAASAVGFVKEGLKSDDRVIRVASIEAATRLHGGDVAAELSPLWQKAEEEEVEALRKAFLCLPVERALPELAGAFDAASPLGKAAILEILGERAAREHADIALAAARNEDENIRKKALAALEAVVREKDLPQVIRLLQTSTEPAAVLPLQKALAACARQVVDPEKRTEPIIKAMREARGQKRIDLLRPLARVGGDVALRAVIAETRSADPHVRSVAVYVLADWPDFGAATELLDIARAEEKTAGRRFASIALQGYARLVADADRPAQQKPALIGDALAVAREPAEINSLLEALGKIRSVESLSLIAPYLADPAFQGKAASAAVDCALASPGFEGLAGFDTARVLKQAATFIHGEYDRGLAERYANELLVKEGFSPLFNGKDLSGWKGLVKDPPARARMTPDALRKEQRAADENMRRHWQVIDGVLVFDGRGQSLCTVKDYADFELFVDWKIEPEGDSGIYLRGSPQVQIWDPGRWPEGSGGLYNNKVGPSKPLQPADNPVGEWNTFYVRLAGDRVTVYLNGTLVVDNVVLENYWERDKPIYAAGQIELQSHSTPLYFKNIYLRELE
jgi:HEAT repeat protein